MKICGIYKITNPKGKVYIGKSIDFHKRMKQYSNLYCKSQILLYQSIKKYGWENHKHELIQQLPERELNQSEINYIWRYNSTNREIN